MQHIKRYIDKSKKVSNEEHTAENDQEVIDQTQEWIDLPETDLSGIEQGANVATALDDLAERTGDVSVAVEHFDWMYRQLTHAGNCVAESYPSLEDYKSDYRQREVLAEVIREHSTLIKQAINLAFEEYSDVQQNRNKELANTLREQSQKLKDGLRSLDTEPPAKYATVQQKHIWTMVHRAGKQVTDIGGAVNTDGTSLDRMLSSAQSAIQKMMVSEIIQGDLFTPFKFDLLFNRTVVCTGNRIEYHTNSLPKLSPAKTKDDYIRGAIKGALWGFLILNPPLGAVIGALGADATGEPEVSPNEMRSMIKSFHLVLNLTNIADNALALSNKLISAMESIPEGEAVPHKREAALTQELLNYIVKHVIELLYGANMLVAAAR